MLNRRKLLAASAGFAVAGHAVPARAEKKLSGIELASIRGSIDAGEFGIAPEAFDDQSRIFSRMLAQAAQRDASVFLPPGTYRVSNLDLPAVVRLSGVPGATRIVYGGDGHLFSGENVRRFELSGLTVDGANRWLGDYAQALIELRGTASVAIDGCEVIGSGKHGIALERSGGRVERSTVTGAAGVALYAVDSTGLAVTANTVADCADGGILVHRWEAGEDNTLVSGNRVSSIGARSGGTGQNGNGINVFRAGNVAVSNNHVSDCAFSAIRSNSGGNVQIAGNTCLRSGETAIYSEFSFEGAVISGNIVDGAATGISIVNFNEGGRLAVCSGNLVRNLTAPGPYAPDPPGFGLGISVEADTSVTGNTIENAPTYGINIGWGPFMRDVATTGNVIRQAGYGVGVTVVEGSGSALIADNIISGAARGAVVGHRWADIVTGDLAADGAAEKFANLTVERNRVS